MVQWPFTCITALQRLLGLPDGVARNHHIHSNAQSICPPQPSSGSEAYLVALYGTYLAAQLLLGLMALTWRPGKASGLLAVEEEGYLVGGVPGII